MLVDVSCGLKLLSWLLTVGKYPSVNTLRRLVFPQAPSPIITSFLRFAYSQHSVICMETFTMSLMVELIEPAQPRWDRYQRSRFIDSLAIIRELGLHELNIAGSRLLGSSRLHISIFMEPLGAGGYSKIGVRGLQQ